MKLKICSLTNENQSFSNCVFAHSSTKTGNLVEIKSFLFSVTYDDTIAIGYIGLNSVHRKLAYVGINEEVEVTSITNLSSPIPAYSVTINVDPLIKSDINIDDNEALDESIRTAYSKMVLVEGIKYLLDFRGNRLVVTFNKINASSDTHQNNAKYFVLADNTVIDFVSTSIKLTSVVPPLFKHNFVLTQLGVGGLDNQFADIFRRAFLSRALPKKVLDGLGIKHVKGMLLYGPPGTGKTLIATQIGKILNAADPKIVQGPSLLNKYVGESEANVRALFTDAINKPDQLHLIICDEFDALCKQRGAKNDGTGVGDNVVNQFLAMIDGPQQLNNILLICMTNRPDLIDDAMKRPGRLEIQVEISLPDQKGRFDILTIHTSTMKKSGYLDQGVNLNTLAELTKNYTGAELAGLVKSAVSYAMARHINIQNINEMSKNDKLVPTIFQDDFLHAMADIKPMFGNVSEELNEITTNPFIYWGNDIPLIRDQITNTIKDLHKGNSVSILLNGDTNTGKTKLLADIASNSGIGCVKIITADKLLRVSDKASFILSVFDQCLRAESSIFFLDNLQRVIEWNHFGGKYDNRVVQTIMTLLRKQFGSDKKVIIIMTSYNDEMLANLEMDKLIDYKYLMPDVMSKNDIHDVLTKIQKANMFNIVCNMLFATENIYKVSDFFKLIKTI